MGKRQGQAAPSEVGKVTEESQVIQTLKKMFEDLKSSLIQQVDELRKSVEFMSGKFDSICEDIAQTRSELKSTQEEFRALSRENAILKQEINDLQQYTRRDNVMVFGAPEFDGKSTYEVIDNICNVIGGTDLVQDVSIAHRLPAKPGKSRPIIIRFCKRRSRDEFLQRFKIEAKKDDTGPGISTKLIDNNLPTGRITAGEQLTATTRDLINKTRDVAKLRGYQFVWSRDGKVFVRKNERSPVNRITSLQDIHNL